MLSFTSRHLPKRLFIRRFSSVHDPHKANIEKYIQKLQNDLKPRLEPYLTKIHKTSEQLRRLTLEVNDSREALKRASKLLNELTGYDHIEIVKQKVNHQAHLFESAREQVQAAKQTYATAIETRSNTQRGINELLQRKHLWTSDDVTKFTELYRLEHQHAQAETAARENYQTCEKQMDREYMELARSIMERYHEEQLWSDKIRSVSTYGTWALMVVNLVLFVMVQTVFEPHKRKRLTDRFEELLVAKVNEEEEKFRGVFDSLNEKDRLIMQQQLALMETVNGLTEHPLFDEDLIHVLKRSASENVIPAIEAPISLVEQPIMEQTVTEQTVTEQTVTEQPTMEQPNVIAVEPSIMTIDKQHIELENELLRQQLIGQSQPNLLLYSIESAIAGGLVTAIAIYTLFK